MSHLLPLILLSIFITDDLYSQEVFAWCPEEQTISPRNGFLEDKKIDLVIYDSRSENEAELIKCSGEVIKKRLVRLITETYTSAEINVLSDLDPGLRAKNNRTLVKIEIFQYHIIIGPVSEGKAPNGVRNPEYIISSEVIAKSSIKYLVEVMDNTNAKTSKIIKDITQTSMSPLIIDYSRAKDELNNAFIEANNKLIVFIDDVFLK